MPLSSESRSEFDGPDLEREASDGRGASRVLNDTHFKDAVRRVRESYHREFERLGYDAVEEMQRLKIKLVVLGDILQELHTAAETGILASEQMRQSAEAVQRRRDAESGVYSVNNAAEQDFT